MKIEAERQRKLVREQLYPMVVDASTSITDASQFVSVLLMSVRQQFQSQMRTQKVKDLDLLSKIDAKADRADKYKKVLELFQDETVSTTTQLLEGFGNAIDSFVKEELTKRPFDSLKTDFL